jgi:sulfur carrier protein ThiS
VKIRVRSHLPWRPELNGEHDLPQAMTVGDFIASLNLVWGEDAMVVVNDQMVKEEYTLQNEDQVELLVPLVGG